jgi:carbonic anhydrase
MEKVGDSGKCEPLQAKNLAAKLSELEQYRSQAITEQRARKTDLDEKLKPVQNHTGPATDKSIANFRAAVVAYNDLKAANSEFTSVQSQISEVQQQVNVAKANKWSMTPPGGSSTAQKSNTTKKASFMDLATDGQVTAVAEGRQELLQRQDCAVFGRSPVDIDTKRVVDATALSPALAEPVAFRYMSLADMKESPRLLFARHGHHLRVAIPPGSAQWPLGGVLSQGVLRGVSYIDIHVPGEHAVNGRVPAAELQLIHESANGKPATAVAVPLELYDGASAEDGGQDNEWLSPLLSSVPTTGAAKEVIGQPLGLLHNALNSGMTSNYYRYDGSLTKPPCLLTEWFVLAEPGRLSYQQLSDLRTALNADAFAQAGRPFMTSLVMRGSPRLVGPIETPEMGSQNSAFLSRGRSNPIRGWRRLQM